MKIVAAIEEIQAEIQRRIDASTWGRGYCSGCQAPVPYRIPDDGFANWAANVAANARPGCEGFILEIIASTRRDYELPPQSLAEAIDQLLHRRRPKP